jgi:prepilin-type N-terminal cleavage/methylation domain-containing protein
MNFYNHKKGAGFTMVELLLVVAIIGLLASLLLGYMEDARGAARDASRKSHLRQMQTALERYRNDFGQYPGAANDWHFCGDEANYIPDISPNYFPELPRDQLGCQPSSSGSFDGYWYVRNTDGRQFKLIYYNPYDSPPAGETFYDTARPGFSMAICSSQFACDNEASVFGGGP